jgi:alpha-L-fucosidase
VGPTSAGLIPQPSIDRLAEIGRWMKVNGEAIYGSSATPFDQVPGGHGKPDADPSSWRCTTKPGRIYLMIFQWPIDGTFELSGLRSRVTGARLLAGNTELQFKQSDTGVLISVPAEAPDKIASVLCLEIQDRVPVVIKPAQAN